MIHIAIVEDDKLYARKLESYLKQYSDEHNEKLKISVFEDGEDIAEKYEAVYDIILMDIQMKFMDGMKAAEKIRKRDGEVVIIFITNMPQYAIEGYAVGALDYVLKPVSYFALSQRLERAIGRMKQRAKKKYIMVSVKGGSRKLDASQIVYAEVWDHNLVFHMVDETVETNGSMRELEKNVEGMPFFRCNKSFLINLEYVDSVQNNDICIGESQIRVSRLKKKALMDELNNYINEVSK